MNVKRSLWMLAIVAFGWALAACSPAPTPSAEPATMPIFTEAPAATAAPYPTEAPAAEPTGGLEYGAAAEAPEGEFSTPGAALAYAPVASRMVIKNAELELLVADSDRAVTQVTQLAADYDGYIISSQSWYDSGYRYASLTLGIPSTRFEAALNRLRGMGLQVLRENASGQDVSAEYVDLQSRLTNLEATAARVREFLDDAKKVEESLKISAQLAELEGQIEQVKGQMRYYEGRAAYSTLTVYITPEFPTPTPTLTPTPTATPTATPGWDPNQTFNDASGVLRGTSQDAADLLIWVGVVFGPPALILLALVMAVRAIAARRLRRG